jgi:hypothetical protein
MTGKSRAAAVQVANQLPVGNGAVGDPVLPCALNRDPQLSVRVFALVKGKRQAVQATVTANALTQASVAGTGLADFSYVYPATYRVRATAVLAPDDADFYATDVEQQVTLARGDKRQLDIEVKPRNVVTPKVDVEYKVVLLDRGLAQHQTTAGEPAGDLLRPDPTYIEVSLQCSADAPPYTGDGTLSAPNCDVFLDADCTQPLGGRKLTHAELTQSPTLRLYLRGTAAGLFTLSLTLDAAADARIDVKPPATQDMGVVTLELQVFQHATPVNVAATTYALTGHCADLEQPNLIPAQVVLSDLDKVTKGRLLHQQSGEDHSRAKALLKLVAAEWPAGTDDYQIVLDASPSSLRAYDAETKGSRQSLAMKTKVSVLKAGDKTLWIEGTQVSQAIRDIRLSLALDRGSGGLAKTVKQHGDWARFTVVKIESVALQYTAPAAGQPQPWNAAKRRWYINYQAGDAGRTVTIRAKLSQPIAGIKLHFMLSPDKDNQKEKNWGIDMPAAGGGAWVWNNVTADVKQKDKVAATDLLHKSQDTDAQGQADCDLILSRIGGDKFRPGAYIPQDPHLAAYVHGHATLEKRKPKLADNRIKVWRKFAYQKVKVRGQPAYPSTGKAEDVYGRVRAEMVKVPSHYVDAAVVQGWARPSLLPEYMFKKNGSNKLKLNVSDANQAQFFNLVAASAEHPIKVVIVTCDFNWGNERNSAAPLNLVEIPAADFPVNLDTDVHVCDPPLQGGALLVSGTWEAKDWDAAANGGAGAWVNPRNGVLGAGDVGVDPKRDGNEPEQGAPLAINKVQVQLPAGVVVGAADTYVSISNLVVQGAPDNFLGGYGVAGAERIVAVFDPRVAYDYQNTVVHELGHAFFQTGSVKFTGVPGQAAVPPAAGIPTNPSFLWTGTGLHCQYNADKCVMFTSGPVAGSLNRYCPDCHPHLLVQDMSRVS